MKTALLLFMLSGQSLDLGSSLVRLHQGCQERNWVLRGLNATTPVRLTVLKGGLLVGMSYGFWKHYEEHPRLDAGLLLAVGGVGWAAGVHNMSVHCTEAQ